MAPSFAFDKRSQRYRYTSGDRNGQFVSIEKLQDLTAAYQAQQKELGAGITDRLLDQKITVREWLDEQAELLRSAHINMFALGFGGQADMGSPEYGAVGARLRYEYGKLRGFAQAVENGTLTPAQIRSRMDLYFSSLWRTYEQGRERGHRDEGYRWERRATSPGEICNDCQGYAAQGWVGIGTLPVPGEASICRANCRCYKQYSRATRRPRRTILEQGAGWLQTSTENQIMLTSTKPKTSRVVAGGQSYSLDDLVLAAGKLNPNLSRSDIETAIADIQAQDRDTEVVDVPEAPTESSQVASLQQETAIEGFYWGQPDEADMEIIQEYTGFSSNAADWYTFPLRASDNLIHSDSDFTWHRSVLENMVRQFPGQALMVDHNYGETENTKGFFTRAQLIRSTSVPSHIAYNQGNGEKNMHRMSRDGGWLQVMLQAALPVTEEALINAVKNRQRNDVSTSTIITEKRYICPHCTDTEGREVSAYERDENGDFVCPHTVPSYWNKMLAAYYGYDDVQMAEYMIIDAMGSDRHFETSLVGVGALYSAEVIRPQVPANA